MLNLKKNAKYFLLLPIISATLFAGIANAGTLRTRNYSVDIKGNCEGEPVCIEHIYTLKNLRTGESTLWTGKAIYNKRGRLVCHEFRNNIYVHRITPDGRLKIIKGGKVILQERGTLQS
ncbi:hypothetical protein NIES4071_26800 [Calothrix sp. NIES-4071]|nr:hypothetical protein NIES4071_26800 [Calothrix sp. NIES-4071]BAZ57002.1 hypothetical protein NIES4105_26740 [Calothrix sp. NIES-4105]